MKKKMEKQQKEEVLCEIWRTPLGVRVKILVNILGMLDWVLTQNCRNTLSLHN